MSGASHEPIRRCTLLVLFQAQQDRATELLIGVGADGAAAIRYKVDAKWYDWKSPGPELAPGIIGEVGRLAAFPEGAFPKEGAIDLPFSGVRLQWQARMDTANADCVLTPVRRE